MKHYAMMLAALVAGVLLFTECASMRIPYRRLPAGAKALYRDRFPTESCVYAERDRDDGRREYEVKLSNGTDIDFHASGRLEEGGLRILVPACRHRAAGYCRRHLAERFPGAKGFRRPSANAAAISSRWAAEREMIYAADGRFIRVEYD